MPNINIPPLPDSVSPLFASVVVLTDPDIKALPTTPFEIVPAQGSGKIIIPSLLLLMQDYPTIGYSNVSGGNKIGIKFGSEINLGSNSFIVVDSAAFGIFDSNSGADPVIFVAYGGFNGTAVQLMQLATGFLSDRNNAPLSLTCQNSGGNFTGGDSANKLTIMVYYSVVQIT